MRNKLVNVVQSIVIIINLYVWNECKDNCLLIFVKVTMRQVETGSRTSGHFHGHRSLSAAIFVFIYFSMCGIFSLSMLSSVIENKLSIQLFFIFLSLASLLFTKKHCWECEKIESGSECASGVQVTVKRSLVTGNECDWWCRSQQKSDSHTFPEETSDI